MSLGKLKMILAALQCNLSMESSMSELRHDPHKTKPYFTEGSITLK